MMIDGEISVHLLFHCTCFVEVPASTECMRICGGSYLAGKRHKAMLNLREIHDETKSFFPRVGVFFPEWVSYSNPGPRASLSASQQASSI